MAEPTTEYAIHCASMLTQASLAILTALAKQGELGIGDRMTLETMGKTLAALQAACGVTADD